jgi:predicted ATPase/DNA-binding SARP family transcriptional activator
LLGAFRVLVHGRDLTDTGWPRRKARQLFKCLLTRPNRRLLKDEATELLWPEGNPAAGAASLRTTLSALRRALEPAELVDADRDSIFIDPGSELWVDADAFEELVGQARAANNARELLERASSLYIGPYLPDDMYEDWATERREQLKRRWAELQLALAQLHEESGELDAAVLVLERLLRADPCHEEAAQQLMRLFVRQGRRPDALRVYDRLVQALRDQLGAEPSGQTIQLREEIAAGDSGPDVPGLNGAATDGRPGSELTGRVLDPVARADLVTAACPVSALARTGLAPSGGTPYHNLPASVTTFVGREQELIEVQERLASGRLLTLTGVGGCGKTRLALEAARLVLDRYSDGVWLVELASLADARLVPHSVAAVVGVRETAGQSITDALVARLGARCLLLVLDNCEHLLDACARLIDALLRFCPEIDVLATSREVLGLTGEIAWRVPSLAVPDLRRLPALVELQHNPAVRLFVERAVAAEPRFRLTERNAPAVAQICVRLDGIPLALELGAARVAALSADQLAARLDQRFRLLTGGSRAALPRQQTLRATLSWSYGLLGEPEQYLFKRLSVFAGGWTLEAAETVCSAEELPREDVLDLLGRLVSKSLVATEESAEGTKRYQLLETVREYAREQLLARGEGEAVQQRHANYYLEFVEALDPEQLVRASALGINALTIDQLEREQDNLRASLRWWIELRDAERAVRQAAAVFPIWFFRGGADGRPVLA